MKKEDDVFRQFRESFERMEGHFHILEQRIPVELQMEYFNYSEQVRKDPESEIPLTENESETAYTLLKQEDIPLEEKKHLLTTLAISKQVKAHRLLSEYAKDPDPAIANWAYMALMESRISLESEFSDEKQIYISTGLGGKNEKLRFYVLFLAREKIPFQEFQKQVIEREFSYLLPHEGCEVERLNIDNQYAEMVFLVPIRADIKSILDKIITECNQYGNFLSSMYTITNVKELSQQEIAEVLTKDGDD